MSCKSCTNEIDSIPTDPEELRAYATKVVRENQELRIQLRNKVREQFKPSKESFIVSSIPQLLFNEMECLCDAGAEPAIVEVDQDDKSEEQPSRPKRKRKTFKLSELPVDKETVHTRRQ